MLWTHIASHYAFGAHSARPGETLNIYLIKYTLPALLSLHLWISFYL